DHAKRTAQQWLTLCCRNGSAGYCVGSISDRGEKFLLASRSPSRLALSDFRLLPFELELLDAVANLIAIEPEQRGRARLVPAAALERLHHKRALELLELDAVRRQLHALGQPNAGAGERKVFIAELLALGEQHRALDGVAQLADIAGPAVTLQALHRPWRHAFDPFAKFRVIAVDEIMHKPRNIFRARAQRRQRD